MGFFFLLLFFTTKQLERVSHIHEVIFKRKSRKTKKALDQHGEESLIAVHKKAEAMRFESFDFPPSSSKKASFKFKKGLLLLGEERENLNKTGKKLNRWG